MTAAEKPAVEIFAEWMLALVLRFWPADSKEWGKAMAAELSNVRSSKEVLHWTIGGMLFFLRSVGYAPIALVFGSAAFFYNFRPFVLAFEDYRSGMGFSADPRFLAGALWNLRQALFPFTN